MVATLVHITPELRSILEEVSDPEIPVLTVLDLGVIREAIMQDGVVKIKLTPTYSGCPAMDVIGDDLRAAFAKQAAHDWHEFVAFRGRELSPGGRLILTTVATDEDGEFGYRPLLKEFERVEAAE